MFQDRSAPRPRLRTSQALLRAVVFSAIAFSTSGISMAEGTRVPMSDAEVLAFGEDPKSGDFFRMIGDPLLDNADQIQPKAINATRYTTIAGIEFRPRSDAANFYNPAHAGLYCQPSSSNSIAEAQLQLPQSAQFQFVRIYGVDNNENDMNVALVERCQPIAAAGNVTTTVLGTVLTSGTPGRLTQSISIPNAVEVDNVLCSYSLRAQLNSVVNGCAPGIELDKVRVQWLE